MNKKQEKRKEIEYIYKILQETLTKEGYKIPQFTYADRGYKAFDIELKYSMVKEEKITIELSYENYD